MHKIPFRRKVDNKEQEDHDNRTKREEGRRKRRTVETYVEQIGLDKKIAERAVKPGFVVDDHFSGPAITRRL